MKGEGDCHVGEHALVIARRREVIKGRGLVKVHAPPSANSYARTTTRVASGRGAFVPLTLPLRNGPRALR